MWMGGTASWGGSGILLAMTVEHRQSARWGKTKVRRTGHGAAAAIALDDGPITEEGQQRHPGRRMTEDEFVAWVHEKTRAEWVDGEVIIMSPVNDRHADINRWLTAILSLWLEEHELGCIRGDVMVRLAKPRSRRVPDIYFFARERAVLQRANHFEGPPDAIFEIVSPDSTARDYRDKVKSYEASGVREYWIVDPLVNHLEANELFKGHYRSLEPKDGALRSKAIKGFFLRPEWCRQTPLPKVADVLRELGGG